MVRLVNKVFAQLDAVAILTVVQTYHATITIVRIHAKIIFVDRMHCVKSKIMWPNANVRLGLKQIQHPNKDVFVFHQLVFQRAVAQMVICALQTYVKYLVLIQFHVRLASAAIIMYAPKFAIQTITVCQEKFVMNVEHVNRDVRLKLIARQRKFVRMENVNADVVLLEHHLDAQVCNKLKCFD